MIANVEIFKSVFEKFGGIWEDINILGIRDDTLQEKDSFNDMLAICDNNIVRIYQATTDPGSWFTKNPLTAAGMTGCAHLCEGFHKGAWMVGKHAVGTNFEHEALVQIGNIVKIWRDKDSDYEQDNTDPCQSGYFGINIHRAGKDNPTEIGRYSAGCQVIRNYDDFQEFMSIIKSVNNWKEKTYSYLLLNKKIFE